MGYVLVLGGARAGKSAYAQGLALDSGLPVFFIATAAAEDGEMEERIARHRSTRPAEWSTVEERIDLGAAVAATPAASFVIVDCLTLWVSNLLGAGRTADQIVSAARAVAHDLAARRGAVVSNEVGLGIVPANKLARTFRDVLGSVNAVFADGAERSVLMVAGRVVALGPA
jgi:adenosyl cobinamide kinase/adenosyl cobinamide phosphate guanylyltransferase